MLSYLTKSAEKQEDGGDSMKEIILLLTTFAMFCHGYYIMNNVDALVKENRRGRKNDDFFL